MTQKKTQGLNWPYLGLRVELARKTRSLFQRVLQAVFLLWTLFLHLPGTPSYFQKTRFLTPPKGPKYSTNFGNFFGKTLISRARRGVLINMRALFVAGTKPKLLLHDHFGRPNGAPTERRWMAEVTPRGGGGRGGF